MLLGDFKRKLEHRNCHEICPIVHLKDSPLINANERCTEIVANHQIAPTIYPWQRLSLSSCLEKDTKE